MRPLSKQEKWQFGFTGSTARTPSAQRAAIAREGLTGATPATILAARRKAFREFRDRKENADLKRLPAWVAAARFEASGDDWLHVSPVSAGRVKSIASLASLACDCVDWGRLRKRGHGNGTAFPPRVRETDNGKTGWDRVVWRYADYLCVESPDGRFVAVQTNRGRPIEVHAVWKNRFLFNDEAHFTELRKPPPPVEQSQKQFVRTLRRFLPVGYDAGIDQRQACILEQSTGEMWHCSPSRYPSQVVADAREAFSKRATQKRLAARNAELDAILASTPERVWVSVADSLNAGNCSTMTDRFRSELAVAIGATGELGAVRSDVILSRRDDEYTRRACRAAAIRRLRS